MTTLEAATTPRDRELEIDPIWLQGRGAYGGLTIAAALRAIEARVADPRRQVRSVTAELPAPTLPGTATVDVDVLRSGSNVTCARATIRQGEELTTHVVAMLGAARSGSGDVAWRVLEPPDLPPWHTVAPVTPVRGMWPEFALQFEYRAVTGVPFTGGDPVTTGWVRPRAPGAARDVAYVAAMIDAWYPALLVRATQPRPIATLAYTLELVSDLTGLSPVEPLAYRGTVPVCRDGYFLETRELWGSDGRLVARNHQTFAIIR